MEKLERLEMAILRAVAKPGGQIQLQNIRYQEQWLKALETALGTPVSLSEVWEAVGSLQAKRLAFVDMSQREHYHWTLCPTGVGILALSDEEFSPYDRAGFMQRLRTMVPNISVSVLRYVDESLGSFHNGLFLASTVMLGAASEAAFLEMADSFSSKMLSGKVQQDFNDVLKSKAFIAKFDAFKTRLDPKLDQLPSDDRDGLDTQLNAVLDAFRRNRNDAGHPSGRTFTRDECYTSLNMAALYLKRLYSLKGFFDSQPG